MNRRNYYWIESLSWSSLLIPLLAAGCTKVDPGTKNAPSSDAAVTSQSVDAPLTVATRPLPECNSQKNGKFLFLTSEKMLFICAENNWMPLSSTGSLPTDSGVNILMVKESIAAGVECPAGGQRLWAVPDKNRNGVADSDEMTSVTPLVACAPKNQIALTRPADTKACPGGGTSVVIGFDLNGNGKLDEDDTAEKATVTTQSICSDLKIVSAVSNLPFALYQRQPECKIEPWWGSMGEALGPMLLKLGSDLNGNSKLDLDEEKSAEFRFMCDGYSHSYGYYDFAPNDAGLVASAVSGDLPGTIDIRLSKPANVKFEPSTLTIARVLGDQAPSRCDGNQNGVWTMTVRSEALLSALSGDGLKFRDYVPAVSGGMAPSFPGAPVPDQTGDIKDQTGNTALERYSYRLCFHTGLADFDQTINSVERKSGNPACSHTVRLTNPSFSSYNVGGFAGADKACADLGLTAFATGKSKAVLSGAITNAIDKIKIDGPVCNSSGQVIAADAFHFFNYPFTSKLLFTSGAMEWFLVDNYITWMNWRPETSRNVLTATAAGGNYLEPSIKPGSSREPQPDWNDDQHSRVFQWEFSIPVSENAANTGRADGFGQSNEPTCAPYQQPCKADSTYDHHTFSLMCIDNQ